MGEEASKRDRVVSQHDQEMEEEIDEVWSTFRLPIPIPYKGRQTNDQKEWLVQAVDQLRLLQTMKEQFANPNSGSSYRSPSKHQRMKGQINLALSGQARIEQTFPSMPPMTDRSNSEDTTTADDDDKQTPIFYENAHRLVQSMRDETEDICNKFHEWLSRHPEQQTKENVIANIFFAPLEPEATQDELLDEFSDEGDEDVDDFDDDNEDPNRTDKSPVPTQKRQSTTRKVFPTKQQQNEDIDPVEFQKQQQELLEEELSSMATRLKSSTLAMNATLQTQTKDLEGMEDIAQANLDKVSSTTKKVEQRLAKNKGWKKKLATWSVIFTVIGMWVLCFMIMRTVPKRKMGNVRVVGWKSWKRFITEKSRRLKNRLDMLLNGESYDSHWEESKATYEKNRQRHKQPQRQQNNQRQECEILPDGSQECRDREICDNPDAKAQQLLAERKQRRIEENMANARTVDPIDPTDIPDDTEAEEDENNECIPPTPSMQRLQKSLEGMANSRNNLTKFFESLDEGSEQRQSFLLKNLQGLHSDYQRYVTALEKAQDAARAEYWAGIEQWAVADMPFCTSHIDKAEFEQNQVAWTAFSKLIKAEEDRLREAQEKETKLLKEAEGNRLRSEAAVKRMAEEEAAVEARKRAEEAAVAKRKAEEAAARKRAEEEAAAARRTAQILAAEARKKAEEAAAKRKAEEEAAAAAAKRNAEEEAAIEARKAEEEAAEAKRKAEELAAEARKRAEEEAAEARQKAEGEAAIEARKRTEEEAADARKRAEEEAAAVEAGKKAEEKAAVEAEARKKSEEEALEARKKADAEARNRPVALHENIQIEATKAMEAAKQIEAEGFRASDVRFAASKWQNDLLAYYISEMPVWIDASDAGGWRPLHEAARAGNLVGIELLISAGCDISSRTGRSGNGGTALWWAMQRYGEHHDVVALLRFHNALEAGPAR
ncbi:vesicle transport protein USE1 [Skeletonema marinoi]|uniref:Vesicle transport protein USE1 n=1 Tax=Skeletonema marinoi TaxID=267567 RepID=A0AAD9DGE5_9STRA|nr:vesicle transport protein USE1 [Skeletonema marinoi]